MDQPKYQKGQKVKFNGDHDRLTGEVLNIKWDSSTGFTYEISSKFYDSELHDMAEGVKICKEDELQDMSGYTGTTEPIIPDKVVNVSEQAGPEGEQVAESEVTVAETQPTEPTGEQTE